MFMLSLQVHDVALSAVSEYEVSLAFLPAVIEAARQDHLGA